MKILKYALPTFALLVSPAVAEQKNAVCAIEQAVVCGALQPCERSLPGGVNLPVLLKIDHAKKTVVSRSDDGSTRNSPFQTVVDVEGGYAIQGTDGDMPWTARVNTTTGRLMIMSLHPDDGYLLFGMCSASILD